MVAKSALTEFSTLVPSKFLAARSHNLPQTRSYVLWIEQGSYSECQTGLIGTISHSETLVWYYWEFWYPRPYCYHDNVLSFSWYHDM